MSQSQIRPSPGGGRDRTAVEQPSTRRGELDLLRALVVAGLVLFHSAVIFGPGEFPVKAAQEYAVAAVFVAFGATWGMPLLFVVSGMGVWYSLGSRGPWAFARERVRRLLVPLLVGVLAIVPLQVYLGLRRAGDTSSYAGFYRRWLDVRLAPDVPFVVKAARPNGVFETGHLWSLVCLLAFSLLLLPGFAFLRRPGRRRLLELLAGVLARPGAILLLVLPLLAVEVPLGSEVGLAAWNRYSYAIFLVYGYLTAAGPRIGTAFERYWRPVLALALLLFVAGGAAYAAADAGGDPFVDTDAASVVFRVVKTLDGWLWVIAILGGARSGLARHFRSVAAKGPAGASRWPGRSGPPRPLRQRGGAAVLRLARDGHRGGRLRPADLEDWGGPAVLADCAGVAGRHPASVRPGRAPYPPHQVPVRPQADPRLAANNGSLILGLRLTAHNRRGSLCAGT